MDGRMFRKWCVVGCLLAASLGCKSNKKPDPFGQMPNTGQPMIDMPVTKNNSRSLWGGNSPPPAMPVEVAPPDSNKPASAEALVAIADVRLDAAFDEKTAPGSKEGLLDLARKGYQKALEQEPKSKSAIRGVARFYARVEEREKSVEMYKKYLSLYPKDADVGHEVAMVHARWKDYPGAVAWCNYTLTNIDPENRAVKKTLGFCQAMSGQWDEAFTTLCQIMPEAQARHNLAGLLDHMGHAEASKAQLQLAVQADPNFAPARGFLTELEQPSKPNPIMAAGGTQE